jgi:hypothetical protein
MGKQAVKRLKEGMFVCLNLGAFLIAFFYENQGNYLESIVKGDHP